MLQPWVIWPPGFGVKKFCRFASSEFQMSMTAYLEEFNAPFDLGVPAQGGLVAAQEFSGALQGQSGSKLSNRFICRVLVTKL